MVEIVKQLGWTYVGTVAAQGEYGEKVGDYREANLPELQRFKLFIVRNAMIPMYRPT